MFHATKILFCRIQNFLFYEPPKTQTTPDGFGTKIINHGPTAMATYMRPQQTAPTQEKAMLEDLRPTEIIPRIEDTPLSPRHETVTAILAGAFNDVAASCKAADALLLGGDVNTVLAGLREYAERYPVAA